MPEDGSRVLLPVKLRAQIVKIHPWAIQVNIFQHCDFLLFMSWADYPLRLPLLVAQQLVLMFSVQNEKLVSVVIVFLNHLVLSKLPGEDRRFLLVNDRLGQNNLCFIVTPLLMRVWNAGHHNLVVVVVCLNLNKVASVVGSCLYTQCFCYLFLVLYQKFGLSTFEVKVPDALFLTCVLYNQYHSRALLCLSLQQNYFLPGNQSMRTGELNFPWHD